MPQDGRALPEQTTHKTWASYVAGLAVSLIVGVGARWGFELGEDATIALLIVLTPLASALATYLKRNWRIDTGATF